MSMCLLLPQHLGRKAQLSELFVIPRFWDGGASVCVCTPGHGTHIICYLFQAVRGTPGRGAVVAQVSGSMSVLL